MEYTVFYQGAEFGHAAIDPDGLYYHLSASAAEPAHGVWRLWACVGEESRLVGVLIPETGGLRLEKRVSRRSWSRMPEYFLLGREAEGFLPWCGLLEEQRIPDAMLRSNSNSSQTLALFPPPEGPIPLAEYVSQMRESELDGRPCLLLDWPPDEELSVENGALDP